MSENCRQYAALLRQTMDWSYEELRRLDVRFGDDVFCGNHLPDKMETVIVLKEGRTSLPCRFEGLDVEDISNLTSGNCCITNYGAKDGSDEENRSPSRGRAPTRQQQQQPQQQSRMRSRSWERMHRYLEC
ncbi:hypothetical protein ACJJTC_015938 [Scirpophaga incertulas]